MIYYVGDTPRRIARLARHSSVLLRVLNGSIRVGDSAEGLHAGGGIPVSAADGIQNWNVPEMEIWIIGDPAAKFELIVP